MSNYENAQSNLIKAVQLAGIDIEALTYLMEPQQEISINFPVRMDDGSVRIFHGIRVQHNNLLGPYKGGIRFHPDANLDEVKTLALLMSLKVSLLGLPYGGGKGAVTCDPKSLSKTELERLSRGYIRAIARHIGSKIDIPAPDLNTNAKIMSWMINEYNRIVGFNDNGTITGKPIELGGSLGRDKATGLGAFFVMSRYLKTMKLDYRTCVIHGFGNAGATIAKILYDNGFKVVGISDSKASIVDENGIDIDEAIEYKAKNKSLKGFGNEVPSSEFFGTKCDILIPSAIENVITKEVAAKLNTKLVVEVANGPTTPESDAVLKDRGIPLLPDILVNAGGVVVSYFEWVQNTQNDYWELEKVNTKLKSMMEKATDNVMANKTNTLRESAQIISVERIAKAFAHIYK